MSAKKPLDVSQKHYTKEEVKEKEAKEIKSDLLNKVPTAPSYLSDEQKKSFKKLARLLIDNKMLTQLDIDTLARYCIAKSQYEYLTIQMNKDMSLLLDKNVMSQYQKINDTLLKLSKELGLTLNSRSKMSVVETVVEKKASKFDKFL